MVHNVLSFRCIGIVHAILVGLLHFSPDDFHGAVHHVVLLGERLGEHTDSGRKPSFRKCPVVTAALAVRVDLVLDLLHSQVRQDLFHDICLNDVVVTKGTVARIVHLAVKCDGTTAMEMGGDGVILATPTGSTAYSLSAGGPIVEPEAQNIVITPICPHDMGSRCIMASDKRTITVEMARNARRNAYLSVDGGKAIRLNMGDVVTVKKSQIVTKLVRLNQRSFYDVVNVKFRKP